MTYVELGIAIVLALFLSASAGLRAFVPLLLLSATAFFFPHQITLPPNMAWLGSTQALVTLIAATFIEILAFYIPILATFLSWLTLPVAGIAGTVIMGVPLGMAGVPPEVQWTLATVLGGGTALATRSLSSLLRTVLALVTGGMSEVVITTLESALAFAMGIASIVLIVLGGIAALLLAIGLAMLLVFLFKKAQNLLQRKSALAT